MNGILRKLLPVPVALLLVFAGIGVGSLASKLQPQDGASGVVYAGTLTVQPTAPLVPVGNGFTYQGRLTTGGNSANGSHDFTFRLYDALTGGNLVGSPISPTAVLTNGLFTVTLDFGVRAFNGEARCWRWR